MIAGQEKWPKSRLHRSSDFDNDNDNGATGLDHRSGPERRRQPREIGQD